MMHLKCFFSGGEKSKINNKKKKNLEKNVRGILREARSFDPKSMSGKYLIFF